MNLREFYRSGIGPRLPNLIGFIYKHSPSGIIMKHAKKNSQKDSFMPEESSKIQTWNILVNSLKFNKVL